MKRMIVTGLAALTLVGACTAQQQQATQTLVERPRVLAPEQAIHAAAASPEDGIEGVFAFRVASVGGSRSRVFLNSAADYHDPGNLSVMLPSATAKEIERMLGAPLETALVAKEVSVTGTARQVKVNVYGPDRKRTGETRTQTRISVASADNIAVR